MLASGEERVSWANEKTYRHLSATFRGREKRRLTNDETTADIEEEDTDVDTLDGLGKIATGVLGLTGGDLNVRVRHHGTASRT